MKSTATLLVLMAASAQAALPDSWQSRPPPEVAAKQPVPASFTEVSLPMLKESLGLLESHSIEPVDPSALPSPIPQGFRCPTDTTPYLVRALAWNPSPSGYAVGTTDGALLVKHVSLGGSSTLHRSALVVCLSVKPHQVFVEAYGAQ